MFTALLWRYARTDGILVASFTLISVVFYCAYADRTAIFEKEQKQFRTAEFLTACLIIALIGLFSTTKPVAHVAPPLLDATYENFLSRNQTDEWKGWMQAIILVYHYTHG